MGVLNEKRCKKSNNSQSTVSPNGSLEKKVEKKQEEIISSSAKYEKILFKLFIAIIYILLYIL